MKIYSLRNMNKELLSKCANYLSRMMCIVKPNLIFKKNKKKKIERNAWLATLKDYIKSTICILKKKSRLRLIFHVKHRG